MSNLDQPCPHERSPTVTRHGNASGLLVKHVERIRQWHEEGLRSAHAKAGSDGQTFDYLGLALKVQPLHGMSPLLGEAVPAGVCPSDRG